MVLVQVNSKNGIYSISIRSTKLRSHKNKKWCICRYFKSRLSSDRDKNDIKDG